MRSRRQIATRSGTQFAGRLPVGIKTGSVTRWDASAALRFDEIISDTLSGQTIELKLNYVL